MKYFCSVIVANITNIYQLPGPTHQLRIEVVPPQVLGEDDGRGKKQKASEWCCTDRPPLLAGLFQIAIRKAPPHLDNCRCFRLPPSRNG